MVADFSRQCHSMEGLVTTRVPGPPAVLDSVALGWHLRICISSQVPGGAVAAIRAAHLEKHLRRPKAGIRPPELYPRPYQHVALDK